MKTTAATSRTVPWSRDDEIALSAAAAPVITMFKAGPTAADILALLVLLLVVIPILWRKR